MVTHIIMMVCLGVIGLCQIAGSIINDNYEISLRSYWLMYCLAWLYLIGWFISV